MAGRIQNSLWMLSPLSPIKKPSFKFINKSHPFRSSNPSSLFSCSSSATHSNDPFVLTTPLYYVNAPPHMGSAYTTIAADAIARFQRLLDKKVILITGTDEHGEKIATAAAAVGSSPTEHCNTISQSYKLLWEKLDIAYDRFIRTTDLKHEAVVNEFYSRVLANGDIYRADYEGLYCVNCEEYKDKNELDVENCCPIHGKPCTARKEDNYFFALSKYQNQLEDLLIKHPDFVQPSSRLNEVQGWVKTGLKDFSISRAAVDWGIRVPDDHNQTIYVWFDALLGYISALSENEEPPNLQNALASGWPASLHLIGKVSDHIAGHGKTQPPPTSGNVCSVTESPLALLQMCLSLPRNFFTSTFLAYPNRGKQDILRFHAVYWPAMLMSAGLRLPKKVFGHGFLTKDGMKMGKSLGNTIEPNELVQKFGADAVRYFFLREVEFGGDGDYSEDRFINIVNAHLANTIGNLLNRTLGLLKKNCESTLAVDSAIAGEGNPLKINVENLVEKASMNYQKLALSSACEAVLEIGNAGNVYMDERAPWSLFKQGGAASEAAAKDLVVILEAMRIIAIALSPVAPSLCWKIYSQLGYTEDEYNALSWNDTKWGGLKAGHVMPEAKPVFARIELMANADGVAPEPVKKTPKNKVKKAKAQST